MIKIKEIIDDYLGFDSSTIFSVDHVRLFGGAVRDILSNQPIKDLDILVGPKTYIDISNILEYNGYEFIESYVSKDILEMYKDIHIINEPKTYMKTVNNKISMVQLIRPSRIDSSINNVIVEAIREVIWNVDFSVCAVSYDGNNLYENYPQAIAECKSMIFTPLVGSKMHNSNRSNIRKHKLESRGWVENGSIDSIRRVKLELLVPDEQVEFIREYNPNNKIYTKYNKSIDLLF